MYISEEKHWRIQMKVKFWTKKWIWSKIYRDTGSAPFWWTKIWHESIFILVIKMSFSFILEGGWDVIKKINDNNIFKSNQFIFVHIFFLFTFLRQPKFHFLPKFPTKDQLIQLCIAHVHPLAWIFVPYVFAFFYSLFLSALIHMNID